MTHQTRQQLPYTDAQIEHYGKIFTEAALYERGIRFIDYLALATIPGITHAEAVANLISRQQSKEATA